MQKKRLIVIGGNAAGMTAASQARRHHPELEIIVFERGGYTSYSICGIPYFIGDLVHNAESLIIRTPRIFREKMNIDVRLRHEVTRIDISRRRIQVSGLDTGERSWESFDHLMIATGAIPNRPESLPPGTEGGFCVNSMADGINIKQRLNQGKVHHAIIVGGGYIGLEMAEALLMRKVEVSLIESAPQVMGTMDADMGQLISENIIESGIHLYLNESLQAFEVKNQQVTGIITDKRRLPADMVILGLGVHPNSGLALGIRNAIQVNDHMQTSIEGIWAAGDCVASHHLLLQQPVYIALGTVANKQGRIAGLNIAGGDFKFPGVIGTAITKFFDLEISRTGLTGKEIQARKTACATGKISSYAHAVYYPDAERMVVKVLADKKSGRLLGAQIVGKKEAGKRIDTLATAIQAGLTLNDIIHLDLAYAPPFSLTWDPMVIAARKARKSVES